MKNTGLHFIAAAVITGGMLLAVAQEGPTQPEQTAPAQQAGRNRGARLAAYLNLTPGQQAQVQAQFQTMRQNAQPIRRQLRGVRSAMYEAVRANDTAQIQQLSTQEANLQGQLSAMRNGTFARIYSTLTPDQKTKADQLPALFRQMRQHRMPNHQNPDNG